VDLLQDVCVYRDKVQDDEGKGKNKKYYQVTNQKIIAQKLNKKGDSCKWNNGIS
jgi:hypothetical protein